MTDAIVKKPTNAKPFLCGDGKRFASLAAATAHAGKVFKETGNVISVEDKPVAPSKTKKKIVAAPVANVVFPHIARKALASTSIRSILSVNFQKPGQTLAHRFA